MLYLPVACPGSGKSYVAEAMASVGMISEDAIVSPDRYREILTDNRADQTVNGEVFKIVDTIVDARISRGLDVYLDATNLNAKLRKKLLDRLTSLAMDFTLPMTVLVSDAREDLLRERNANRAHPVPDHVFDRFYSLAVDFNPNRYVDEYDATVMTFDEMMGKLSPSRFISITILMEARLDLFADLYCNKYSLPRSIVNSTSSISRS